jgi:hypothetical protein
MRREDREGRREKKVRKLIRAARSGYMGKDSASITRLLAGS